MDRTEYTYHDLPTVSDERATGRKGRAINEYNQDLYNSLVNIVLNHKAELQKIPALASPNAANQWAQARGLRSADVDLNKDGVKETIIYNKAGQPYIINGYKTRPSDYKVRRDYYEANPTVEDRIGNPMKSWAQNHYYDVKVDPERPWLRSVHKTDAYRAAKEWGYKLATKPKKAQTPFAYFSKLINPMLKLFFETDDVEVTYRGDTGSIRTCAGLLGGNANAYNGQIIRKIISPISMARALFVMLVERFAFYELIYKSNHQGTYEQWKKWKKDNKNRLAKFFFDNFLSPDKKSFNNRITMLHIASCLCKDEMNFDGSDPEDVLVFLIGTKNLQGDNVGILVDNGAGQAFWETLTLPNVSKAEKTAAKKTLERMKKISQASIKEWFKTGVAAFFENQSMLDRFIAYRDQGLDPNVKEIIGDVPASPVKADALTQPVPPTDAEVAEAAGEQPPAPADDGEDDE